MKTGRNGCWKEKKIFDLGSDTSVYSLFIFKASKSVRRAQKKAARRAAKKQILLEVEDTQK